MLIPEKSWKRTKNNSLKSASVQSTSKKNWVTHSWTSSGCDFLNHMFVYLESCYQGNFIKDMHKASKLTNDYYYQGIYQDDPSKKKINDSRVNRWKLERMKKKGKYHFLLEFHFWKSTATRSLFENPIPSESKRCSFSAMKIYKDICNIYNWQI